MRPHARPFLFALAAAVISIAVAVVPTVPAAAETVAKEAMLVDAQTFVVAEQVAAPVAALEAYTVTEVTVVQWPVWDHTVTPGEGNFGYRTCRGCPPNHHGIDLNPGYGSPVEVIADGVVTQVGWNGTLGWSVTVNHLINGQPVQSVYGHMIFGSSPVVYGQSVSRGDLLGAVGDTGLSTGPHLHFEVHVQGGPVDPEAWMLAYENAEDWAWLKPIS